MYLYRGTVFPVQVCTVLNRADFLFRQACHFRDVSSGESHGLHFLCDGNFLFRTTFRTANFHAVYNTLLLRRVKRVLKVTIGLEAVLVFTQLDGGELRYLRNLEKTVEYLVAKGGGTLGERGEVLQGIQLLVVEGDQLAVCLVELCHLYIYELELVIEDTLRDGGA